MEMVIALAIMVVVIAAMLPQVKAINDGWDSRRGGSNAFQNGNVLIDQLKLKLKGSTDGE